MAWHRGPLDPVGDPMKQQLLASTPSFLRFVAAFALVGLAAPNARAQSEPSLAQRFSIPESLEQDGAVTMNLTPDGRVVTVDSTGVITLETQRGSGQFQTLGELPDGDFSSFGAAFIAVSPDGSTLAVGNNGGANYNNAQVGVFELNNLQQGRWLSSFHFAGLWWNNRELLLSSGSLGRPSDVVVLDTQSPLAAAPQRIRVVQGIGGASGGIALDAQENLWTGNGYRFSGPSESGAVHRIARDAWQGAYNQDQAAVNFESEATPVLRALSAGSLAFDTKGNLWVGGSSSASETGFAALFLADKLEAVLQGDRAPLDSKVAADVIKIDTDAGIVGQNYAVFARPDGPGIWLLESESSNAFAYTYAQDAAPAPALGGLGALALLGLGLGASFLNQKRKA